MKIALLAAALVTGSLPAQAAQSYFNTIGCKYIGDAQTFANVDYPRDQVAFERFVRDKVSTDQCALVMKEQPLEVDKRLKWTSGSEFACVRPAGSYECLWIRAFQLLNPKDF